MTAELYSLFYLQDPQEYWHIHRRSVSIYRMNVFENVIVELCGHTHCWAA